MKYRKNTKYTFSSKSNEKTQFFLRIWENAHQVFRKSSTLTHYEPHARIPVSSGGWRHGPGNESFDRRAFVKIAFPHKKSMCIVRNYKKRLKNWKKARK